MARRKRQLDNRVEIVTPENIGFEYRIAGPFYRLPAYLVDVIIRLLMVAGAGMLATWLFGSLGMHGVGIGVVLIVWFVVEWFYGGLFETYWNGQTPGKRMFHIRVVAVDGQPINALQAVLRNILRAVDGLPMLGSAPIPLFQVGLLACLLSNRYQRLGDMACGTLVIVEQHRQSFGVSRMNDPQVIALAATLPVNFGARRSTAQALSKYVERRDQFVAARRLEIAGHLAGPLVRKLELPPDTNADLLLCALYHRVFLRSDTNQVSEVGGISSPPNKAWLPPAEPTVDSLPSITP